MAPDRYLPATESRAEAARQMADRDRAAAARDHAADDRDHEASDRDTSQAEADRRSSASNHLISGADERTVHRDQAAADRDHAAADREDAAADRDAAARDLRQARLDLRHAQLDQLTGAYGRELGLVALEQEIERARRGNGRLVLAYVDVDGLKQVNDSQGHAAGDALLRAVVAAITAHLRSYDLVVRVGGDEFVCALGGSEINDSRRRFREIQTTIAETQPAATCSVGFADLRSGDTLDELTARGDAALYDAKLIRHT